ncbi:ABC transporter [Peniophora sp. CONT]|nr:ABC transporter [Peniophora sp. CONT]
MTSPTSATEQRKSIDEKELASPTLSSPAQADDIEKHAGEQVHYSFPRRTGRSFKEFFVPLNPPPPFANLDDAPLIPEATASFVSLLTFQWISQLLALGYTRPLEATDLWKLQPERSCAAIADKINASFDARVLKAEEYNKRLRAGEINPSLARRLWWGASGKMEEKEKMWREKSGRREASLVWAMNDAVRSWVWAAGIYGCLGETAQMLTPLLLKKLVAFADASYSAHLAGERVEPIAQGIGYAFGILGLQLFASMANNHYAYQSAATGVLLRGGLINAIYSRSLRLTTRARGKLPNGRLVNHISTDVSRIDFACGFFHYSWIGLVVLAVGIVLLIINLGPSALAGIAFFLLVAPAQGKIVKMFIATRMKTMVWTDKRAKLLQELLGGMKIIKFFAWEKPFLRRIAEYRKTEMRYIRYLLMIRSANTAIASSTPTLAAVITFLVYAASGHTLTAANVFSSLSLFTLLRLPLMLMPLAMSASADAYNAIGRLRDVFTAELISESLIIDPAHPYAVQATNTSFTWDVPPPEQASSTKKKSKRIAAAKAQERKESVQDEPFEVTGIDLKIPRGSLVAIVGPVGSGKTSLLQGLIGEMRLTSGSVTFGGDLAYCSQSAWIQNATIRENICFGRPFEEERYWKAVNDACLDADLDVLPAGDMTEVGEKGISLSGGQKQRVNICRAIYADTAITIFDDPLSALDAHVGESVFNNVLSGDRGDKTRILVTHALHFLHQVDHIYCVLDGRIVQQGTYEELIAAEGAFSAHINEFTSQQTEEEQREEEEEGDAVEEAPVHDLGVGADKKRQAAVKGEALMQKEERNTGAVAWDIYKAYFKAGNGIITVPILVATLVLTQVVTVLSSYWLVWWESGTFHQPQGFYMGIYAALGVALALCGFANGVAFAVLAYTASRNLHLDAITRVMRAPMSWFDTTPLGRIMNRFSKDVDTMDNTLADSIRVFLSTVLNIFGAVILVAIVVPWFLIAIGAILILYALCAAFYRKSAREIKRLDAILRSSLYAHFSESLSGLSTIRAYGEEERFLTQNKELIDTENRAYYLTVVNQRWLTLRLDLMGTALTFCVSMLTLGTRTSISPAQTGVAISYILSVQQAFSWTVRQLAEVENDMNSVERIVYYAKEVEQEAPQEILEAKPVAPWPSKGQIEMKGLVLRYRPELPPVLKGLSMTIRGGEQVGIVGRTGAGKSSIMTTLYRIVELSEGKIEIDGVDISKIGLTDLRQALSIIPQEAQLFSGTLRSNLDPFGLHDDARLWDALRRSYLVDDIPLKGTDGKEEVPAGASTPNSAPRFTLDSVIEDEGSNVSVGQRSLVSLARALVKDSRILILDEATASVDYETDRKIQETIATEFKDRTILTIAHRLRTIISYDRICVMDQGIIAEFDTPSSLFLKENGIFRGMCERSGITFDDIRLAARER